MAEGPEQEERQVGLNLEGDKQLNIKVRLDFSSTPKAEALQADEKNTGSLSAPRETRAPAREIMNCAGNRSGPPILNRSALAELSNRRIRTVRTWCWRSGAVRRPPIPIWPEGCCRRHGPDGNYRG
jgi:hypothetical protein